MTCHQQGQDRAARNHLDRALKLARPEGIILPFVEWHPTLAKEMRTLIPRESDWHIKQIRQILSRHPTGDRDQYGLAEALTNRELDVLGYLAKRLYDKEIAEQLGISVDTVRTHMKRIRGKLGVSSRREATVRAMELGILSQHG